MTGAQDDEHDLSPVVDDPLVRGFGVLLEVTARLERLAGEALENEHGISHVMFEVLLRLAGAPGRRLPIGEIGRRLVVTSGGATRLVLRMQKLDLVYRSTSTADRRVQMVELTNRGADVLDQAGRLHAQTLREHLAGPLPPDELSTMLATLDRLGSVLRERLPHLG